jgi:hypothetical protein
MSESNKMQNQNGTTLVNYEKLLDKLIDETREMLLEKKKKNFKLKQKNRELLFDQFIYINTLRNTAKTEKEYKEAYEILSESIQKFRGQSAG